MADDLRSSKSARRRGWSRRGAFTPWAELLQDHLLLCTISWDGGGKFHWNNVLKGSTA
jgi:hypothetical protein